MELEGLLLMLAGSYPWAMLVLSALGSLVVVAQAVVLLTPTKKDDEMLADLEKSSIGGMLLKALKAFAVISKK